MPRQKVTARLYTDSGGWGLPTIDADGLAAHALLRFADIPYATVQGASPSMTSANVLPVVIFQSESFTQPSLCAGLASLVALFTADLSLPDPNKHLTPFMIAESTAFASLITSRFSPALKHDLFVNDANYAEIYRSLLRKDTAWPLNQLVPFLRRREIRRSLAGNPEDALYFESGIALAALSTRLGDRNKFFYGDNPSVLDAIVFGHLASVLCVPLPDSKLRGQVAMYSNLVSFVGRIRQTYFEQAGEMWNGELDAAAIAEARRAEADRRARETTRPGAEDETENNSEEAQRKRGNTLFIWGSVAAFAAHLLLADEIEIGMLK